MASALIHQVAQKFFGKYSRLVFVKTQDNFLDNETVCQQLFEEHKIKVVGGSQLELRINFELEYKENQEYTYVYLVPNISTILPDMKQEGKAMKFTISDLFPFFDDKTLLRSQPLEVLERLYDGYAKKQMKGSLCTQTIDNIRQEIESFRRTSVESLHRCLQDVAIDWNNQDTIKNVSEVISAAIEANVIGKLDGDIRSINQNFQEWVDSSYFGVRNNSPINGPKCVNKILPFLSLSHKDHGEKVALFVVDGFTYWQYTILRGYLAKNGCTIQDGSTLSWLPSITKLSRQAIFRGVDPKLDYIQSPQNERQLWRKYWEEQNFAPFEIQYISDKDEMVIGGNVRRLAVVTIEIDEKMHSSPDYKELWLRTNYWCGKAMETIKTILNAGFTIYLTTDHGSVLSTGWGTLTNTEKAFLYKDGSRGARHLIYNDKEALNAFMSKNNELHLLHHNDWLCMREDQCFTTNGKQVITHGGSHFMEVVIPFVKITN